MRPKDIVEWPGRDLQRGLCYHVAVSIASFRVLIRILLRIALSNSRTGYAVCPPSKLIQYSAILRRADGVASLKRTKKLSLQMGHETVQG